MTRFDDLMIGENNRIIASSGNRQHLLTVLLSRVVAGVVDLLELFWIRLFHQKTFWARLRGYRVPEHWRSAGRSRGLSQDRGLVVAEGS